MSNVVASDLIFSSQANHNFSKTLGDLKRHTLSIHNRLRSIVTDADFVQEVSAVYHRPLVANERCGSWYIDPKHKIGSAYFKSTDGHTGVWKFSTRRLNTQLLSIIGKHDGFVPELRPQSIACKLIILDVLLLIPPGEERVSREQSSWLQSHKLIFTGMPDALSKTVPIWCCVLNRVLFPRVPECHNLYTPLQVISSSENTQISARLDFFVESFLALDLDVAAIRRQILKPLRPIWVTPESYIAETVQIFEEYHPVICCTASRRIPGGEISEGGYIQGSGDDTENWAYGLTPPVFWANSKRFLDALEADLPDLIAELVATPPLSDHGKMAASPLPPTTSLYIVSEAQLAAQLPELCDITISLLADSTDANAWQASSTRLDVGLGTHKLGSRKLRLALPHILTFVVEKVAQDKPDCSTPPKILIACPSGKDHAIGVALALLCLIYDDEGNLVRKDARKSTEGIDKEFIRRKLAWIMTAMPDANPSRSTLQSVNSYLMERPG